MKTSRELTLSKVLVQPNRKRLCAKSSNTRANLSGRFCKARQEKLQSVLNENFVESPGKVTCQETVMNVLDLSESEKGPATRTVNNVFPSVSLNKHTKSYRNIRKLTSFEFKKDSTDEVYPDANSEILNVQHLLVESRQKLKVCLDDIISRVETGNTEHIEALLKAHRRQSDIVTNYSETLDKLYEKEIKSLKISNFQQMWGL